MCCLTLKLSLYRKTVAYEFKKKITLTSNYLIGFMKKKKKTNKLQSVKTNLIAEGWNYYVTMCKIKMF